MGNFCSSCCGNRDDDIFENSETDKTNLLGSPVGEASRTASQSISNKHSSSLADHQAKLNHILEKTANSYIDVPALNSPLEQQVDKSKDYGSQVKAALEKHHSTEKTSLLQDVPHIERLLSDEPLSDLDRNMVKEANLSILAAVQSIQIENTENLVIPFDIPKNRKE